MAQKHTPFLSSITLRCYPYFLRLRSHPVIRLQAGIVHFQVGSLQEGEGLGAYAPGVTKYALRLCHFSQLDLKGFNVLHMLVQILSPGPCLTAPCL